MSIDSQWPRATKATPVAELGVMAFVDPSLTADTNRSLDIFLSLAHSNRRAREGNVFS